MSATANSTNPAQTIPPLTADMFNVTNMTIGRANKFEEYGFTKYRIGYTRPDTQDDKCVIKLTNLDVFGVYPPKADKDGKLPKNPKYSMSLATTDPVQIKFFEDLNKHMKYLAGKYKANWFPSGAEFTDEDIDMLYTKPVGSFANTKDGQPSLKDGKSVYKFSVSFPFNNSNVKEPVNIHYYEPNIEPDVVQSVNLLEKVGYGSVIDIFLNITNIKVDDTNEFDCQRTIHKRINVQKFSLGGSSGGAKGPSKGMSIAELDLSKIVLGDVVADTVHGGRSLKPKYDCGAFDKEGKKVLKSVSITMPDIKCAFKRQVKVNDETGLSETSYDIVYNLDAEYLAKFKAIDEHIKQDMLANYSSKYEPGKKINAKLFDSKFRGAVKIPEKYEPNMWYSVFTKKRPDGTFDFGGNFYKPDGTKYTDIEVEKDIFGKTHKCTLTVYLKHVWFGKYYSTKFNFGNAVLSTTSVDYDYGDAYNDSQPVTTPSASYSASADLDQDEVASQGSVMSDGN